MRLQSFVSPKKNPLCYCNAMCKVCRSVANNLSKFESTYRQISKALNEFDLTETQYKKQKKKQSTYETHHQQSTFKPHKQSKPAPPKKPLKCRELRCLSNPNQDLLKQNTLLNEYFDMFQQRYKSNKVQLNDLKNQNLYLREMMQQLNSKQKQKDFSKIEDLRQTHSKMSFSKKQNDIIKRRLLEDISNRKDEWKESSSTFIVGFSKMGKKGAREEERMYSEGDEYTPSNQNYYTSNDENSRY